MGNLVMCSNYNVVMILTIESNLILMVMYCIKATCTYRCYVTGGHD